MHLAIRRLDEAEFVDARKGRHRADQPDVRPFWRFDRTNAPVVGWMDVAHFEAGAIAAETTRPESRQATLVRQLRKRVRLVHELGKLRTPKEVTNDRAQRLR